MEWTLRDGWYWPHRPCAKGHLTPRNRFNQCIQCTREYRKTKGHFRESTKNWQNNNRDRVRELSRIWHKNNPEKRLLTFCKVNAKRQNVPFDLTLQDIKIPTLCPVFGVKLRRNAGKRDNWSPSVDRIIPEKGYVRNNIIIVSWRANFIKSDATIEELEALAIFYRRLTK